MVPRELIHNAMCLFFPVQIACEATTCLSHVFPVWRCVGPPVSEPWDVDVGPYNPLSSSGSAPHPPRSCNKAAPVGMWWCVFPALPVGSEGGSGSRAPRAARPPEQPALSSLADLTHQNQNNFVLQVGRLIAPGAPGGPPGGHGEKCPKRNEWGWATGASEIVWASGRTSERRSSPLASINGQ